MKEIVSTPNAPQAIGPYSQAVVHNGLAYLGGQIPLDPATGAMIAGGVAEQTVQVLENLKAGPSAQPCHVVFDDARSDESMSIPCVKHHSFDIRSPTGGRPVVDHKISVENDMGPSIDVPIRGRDDVDRRP